MLIVYLKFTSSESFSGSHGKKGSKVESARRNPHMRTHHQLASIERHRSSTSTTLSCHNDWNAGRFHSLPFAGFGGVSSSSSLIVSLRRLWYAIHCRAHCSRLKCGEKCVNSNQSEKNAKLPLIDVWIQPFFLAFAFISLARNDRRPWMGDVVRNEGEKKK